MYLVSENIDDKIIFEIGKFTILWNMFERECKCNASTENIKEYLYDKVNKYDDKIFGDFVKTIKEVKLIYELEGKGCLILLGNLGCDFRQPMGGMFFCKRVYIDQNVDYHAIKGVEMNICFSNYPLGIER